MNSKISMASLGLLATAASLHAATAEAETTPSNNAPATVLDELVITVNRLNHTLFQQVQPASVLKDKELLLNLQPTLGETLNNQPGVSATSFGPAASRPIIRGLGSDRVRVLQNGTSVLDVSNVSPDHAVASDPLSIKSVEVVRGPASLLYGPNTIGGVVNVIDERIPQERFEGKWPSGKVETSAGSADDLFSQAGAVNFGHGNFAFHLDAFNRETDDLHIPGFARSERLRQIDPQPNEAYGVLPNSASHSQGAGIGGSYIWDGGYFGLAYSGVDSHYGTVAEPDVTIDMRQRRWDFRGAFTKPTAWLKEINYKLGISDYEHTEFEGTTPGTEFLIKGHNGRVEFLHEKLGAFEGAFGFESQGNEFSAVGEEAFLPEVRNNVNSLFFFEEIAQGKLRYQFGARYDHQTNETGFDADFGPGTQREFDAFSLSGGIVYTPVDDYAIACSVAYTQRPPTYVELFANGPHVATGTFEIGDSKLGTEDSLAFDLSVRKKAGRVTGSAGVFYYRFNDFINLQPTGMTDPGEGLPIFAYQAVDADFHGAELESTFHLLGPVSGDENAAPADEALDLGLRADFVHAENRKTGEDLPQMPPLRVTPSLMWRKGNFAAKLEGTWAAHQDRHADYELPTNSYFLINASLSYDLKLGDTTSTLYVKGLNLTDEEVRYSTSVLKDIAPAAGRGVLVGLRTEF